MMKFKSSFIKNRSGVVALEAAILVPIIILLSLALLEFGLYYLKSQTVLNALGTVGNAIQQDPEDGTIRELALDSGGSFTDFRNRPNFFCAEAHRTYEEAQAGTCDSFEWSTYAGSVGLEEGDTYYVVLHAQTQKTGIGLISSFLPDMISRKQIIKVGGAPKIVKGMQVLRYGGGDDDGNDDSYRGSANNAGRVGSWTVPEGVNSVKVTMVAGGGGGCGSYAKNVGNNKKLRYPGTGGGGGGGAIFMLVDLEPGDVISYRVGAGGAGADPGDRPNNPCAGAHKGGNTKFNGMKVYGGRKGNIDELNAGSGNWQENIAKKNNLPHGRAIGIRTTKGREGSAGTVYKDEVNGGEDKIRVRQGGQGGDSALGIGAGGAGAVAVRIERNNATTSTVEFPGTKATRGHHGGGGGGAANGEYQYRARPGGNGLIVLEW